MHQELPRHSIRHHRHKLPGENVTPRSHVNQQRPPFCCAAGQDIQISADEGKRLPLNFLMVKAMHDRQLLAQRSRTAKTSARNRPRADLSPRDQRTLRRSAHYARFAAASYDGVVDTVKEILAEGDTLPPPDLFAKRWEEGKNPASGPRQGAPTEKSVPNVK